MIKHKEKIIKDNIAEDDQLYYIYEVFEEVMNIPLTRVTLRKTQIIFTVQPSQPNFYFLELFILIKLIVVKLEILIIRFFLVFAIYADFLFYVIVTI